MTQEEIRLAKASIMEEVCDLCHWPYQYKDPEIMYAEKCNYCPAHEAVTAAFKPLEKEAALQAALDGKEAPA